MKEYKIDNKKQTVVLVRGIQGSGKSTFAEKLKNIGF